MDSPILQVHYKPRIPPKTDYGIGIIGCGGIVNDAHLPAYKAHSLNVRACYDLNPDIANKTAATHNIPLAYQSLDDLLADQSIQIVDIAVHPGAQPAIAVKALQAGKHLLCQKPLAVSYEDALIIVETSKQTGLLVAVNQQMRWDAGIAAAKDLIDRGFIGQPTDAQIQVSSTTPLAYVAVAGAITTP